MFHFGPLTELVVIPTNRGLHDLRVDPSAGPAVPPNTCRGLLEVEDASCGLILHPVASLLYVLIHEIGWASTSSNDVLFTREVIV